MRTTANPPIPRRQRHILGRRESLLGYGFFMPSFAVLCLFLLWPCLQIVLLSLTNTNLLRPDRSASVGLANYQQLYQSVEFWSSLSRSLSFTSAVSVLSIVISYLIANLVNFEFRGRQVVYMLLFLPWVVSDVITAFVFRWNYDMMYGVFNYLLVDVLGILARPVSWLGNPDTVMAAVVVPTVWRFLPFSILVILAALKQVPGELIEAARMDGANGLGLHRHIILPAIAAPLVILVTLRVGAVFRSFDLVWLLTQGGPGDATRILPVLYYQTAFTAMQVGYAAAIAVNIFMFVFLVYLVIYVLFGREAF